ncbi:hypothetical protein QJS04_geneDACA006645 [Acorus gramineus]|uniref:NADH dehydrogenase subunit 6 n=1 Tax=Acorus gramineus TaxID=55184 RepID=A0AAV9A2R9_ACOGR|nr:hypothetical protein QJS04_geneDACA006645 [Acorus gramineus]
MVMVMVMVGALMCTLFSSSQGIFTSPLCHVGACVYASKKYECCYLVFWVVSKDVQVLLYVFFPFLVVGGFVLL